MPVYLEKAKLRILKNNLKSCKFRIRINEVDKATGRPGRDLLNSSVVIESALRKGWIEFDLSTMNILINDWFFLTFEQILDVHDRTRIADGYREFMQNHPDKLIIDTVEFEGQKIVRKKIDGNGIDLPGTFIAISTSKRSQENFICFTRNTSFAEWERVRGIVCATATLSNQQRTKSRKRSQ